MQLPFFARTFSFALVLSCNLENGQCRGKSQIQAQVVSQARFGADEVVQVMVYKAIAG